MSLPLLYTTFLIDSERGGVDRDKAIDDDDDMAIAAVTVAELLVGVKLSSAKRRKKRRVNVDELIASLPIIAYDPTVAIEHAELLAAVRGQSRPRGAHDLLIAATARAINRAVVTADRAAFNGLPDVTTIGHR